MNRRLVVAGSAIAAVALVVAIAGAPANQAAVATGCAAVSLRDGSRLMQAYARAGAYPTVQANARAGVPARVSVDVPQIRFTGAGRSSTLPVGPCQHISLPVPERPSAWPGGAVAVPIPRGGLEHRRDAAGAEQLVHLSTFRLPRRATDSRSATTANRV